MHNRHGSRPTWGWMQDRRSCVRLSAAASSSRSACLAARRLRVRLAAGLAGLSSSPLSTGASCCCRKEASSSRDCRAFSTTCGMWEVGCGRGLVDVTTQAHPRGYSSALPLPSPLPPQPASYLLIEGALAGLEAEPDGLQGARRQVELLGNHRLGVAAERGSEAGY